MDGAHPPRPSVRWWPAALIGLGAAAALSAVWTRDEMRQHQVLSTLAISGCAIALLFLWAMLFSRLRWRDRGWIALWAITLVAVAAAGFRIRGVSGDLVPVIEWRWDAKPGLPQPETSAPSPAAQSEPASLAGPDAESFPQFLGPSRDGRIGGLALARDWARRPPKELWRIRVGPAWSGFAAARGLAITQEQRGEDEVVAAYDLRSGRPRWAHIEKGTRYHTVIAGEGPRATPAIAGDRVLAAGATGILACLDLPGGKLLWRRDLIAENGARLKEWGYSSSPLVDGDLVIVQAGGKPDRSLVAYRLESGELAWSAGERSPNYASPLLARLAGRAQFVVLNSRELSGHAREDGRILWSSPWPHANPSAAQPLPLPGDRLLVSAGYGVGAKLLRIEAQAGGELEARLLWENRNLKAKFANFVHRDGFVYGLDDGILVCLEVESGERRWKAGRYGHGQMLLAGDLLLVSAEAGAVHLVEASPAAHRELASLPVFADKTWNSPALAGRLLLVRNDREAACLELATE